MRDFLDALASLELKTKDKRLKAKGQKDKQTTMTTKTTKILPSGIISCDISWLRCNRL